MKLARPAHMEDKHMMGSRGWRGARECDALSRKYRPASPLAAGYGEGCEAVVLETDTQRGAACVPRDGGGLDFALTPHSASLHAATPLSPEQYGASLAIIDATGDNHEHAHN